MTYKRIITTKPENYGSLLAFNNGEIYIRPGRGGVIECEDTKRLRRFADQIANDF